MKMLDELREILPEGNFKKQPDSALEEILKLEKKYSVNTQDVLNDESLVRREIADRWIQLLETYLLFKGEMSKINKV